MSKITVDLHAHAIVPDALVEMQKAHHEYGPVLIEDSGLQYLKYPARERLGPLPDGIFDPKLRIADMDRQRVDRQIIAIPPPNFHYHIDGEVGIDFARIQNDGILSMCDSNPDRFHMFATLPLQDIDASIIEVRRIAASPLVRGVQFGTNINGVDLDDPMFTPLFDVMEELDLPMWLHPDQRSIAGIDRLTKYYLQNFIGNPLESTIAMGRIIFGGVMDRHPTLRFGFVHGGGFTPYQTGRWDHGWAQRSEAKEFISDIAPSEYFKRFFIDSLTHDPLSLELLGRRMGWGQVVLGSDYPFDMASEDPVGGVDAVGILTDDERDAVLCHNADRFLRPCPAHVTD
ncbi:MAG: aminocarboxymuconate-semialdehyde decarboxylase [Minisyncoccia bacterium]